MTNAQLYSQISALPEALKNEVADFIAFLQHKAKNNETIKERKFGCAKGLIDISPDFDDPLEDFNEYI